MRLATAASPRVARDLGAAGRVGGLGNDEGQIIQVLVTTSKFLQTLTVNLIDNSRTRPSNPKASLRLKKGRPFVKRALYHWKLTRVRLPLRHFQRTKQVCRYSTLPKTVIDLP